MKKILSIVILIIAFACGVRAQEVHYLTTEEFKDCVFDYTRDSVWQYKGETPCIIDFYTTWCGPCKRLAPVMEELAKEHAGEVIFYKADTERERELAYLFRISSIPQLLFIPVNGQPAIIKGAYPKEQIEAYIQQVLLGKKQ